MKSKTMFILAAVLSLLAAIGCTQTDDLNSATGNLKLSLTDAPADDFKEVWVTFDSVAVSTNSNGDSGWITINDEAGTIDLLTLNNGKLEEIGIANLEPAKYNQIRIFVSNTKIVLKDGTEITNVHLASDTIKLVKPFTIEEGITTELVVDFDAAHSIKKTSSTDGKYSYTMTPVTRIADVKTTGKIIGSVTPIEGKTITVTAYTDSSTTSYAGTVCDESGDYIIGYLEPGIYDLVVSTTDASVDIADIEVIAGEASNANTVTLN